MNVTINPDEVDRVLNALGCRTPPGFRILEGKPKPNGSRAHASYHGGLVTLYLFKDELNDTPRNIARTLNEYVLHELRHHWQVEEWSADEYDGIYDGNPNFYWGSREERDAREFAASHAHLYRTVRVVPSKARTTPGRGFARLSAVQSQV